jgi:rod shape-determining protein MreC
MLLKKKFFIFIFFILLIFAFLTYQGIKKDAIFSTDLPIYPLVILERGISTLTGGIRDFFASYIFLAGKERENRMLAEQVKRIEQEKDLFLEAKLENDRLRDLLELKSRRSDYVTTAEVFARDPTNWFQSLWIDKGRDDGVSKDMIAVTATGVVGKVHRVLKDNANIILLTDINSSVAARIQSSRVEGILQGSGDDKCYLEYVFQDSDVSVGDRIITSGLDGIFPEGLRIGSITDVKKKSGDLFYVIEITTSQNLNSVEEVVILKR